MNKTIRIVFILGSLLLLEGFQLTVSAQDFSGGLETESTDDETGDDASEYNLREHLRFGGNVGAQFGNVTFINVSPMLGYQFNDRFMMGVRGTYQYFRLRGLSQYSSNVLGGSVFSRLFVIENLFAHGEYEVLNGHFDNNFGRDNIPFLYFGAGYIFPISEKFGVTSMILYEVLRPRFSPYGFPILRVGIIGGL